MIVRTISSNITEKLVIVIAGRNIRRIDLENEDLETWSINIRLLQI